MNHYVCVHDTVTNQESWLGPFATVAIATAVALVWETDVLKARVVGTNKMPDEVATDGQD